MTINTDNKKPYHFPVQSYLQRQDMSIPAYARLAGFLRQEILSGHLKTGQILPPSRLLAADIGCARKTITLAYETLIAEDMLEARQGSGTFVSSSAFQWVSKPSGKNTPAPAPINNIPIPPRVQDQGLKFFPKREWLKLYQDVVSELTAASLGYGQSQGHPNLRKAVSAHLRMIRGIEAHPDQILITQGSQQALNIIFSSLFNPGNRIITEDPLYQGARAAIKGNHLLPLPFPVDEKGIVLEGRLKNGLKNVHGIYVTPSCQFPLGHRLSLERRHDLLSFAQKNNCWIIEDDYDSEFDFTSHHPLSALATLDTSGRVLYVGSFSKSLAPALRLGFLVAPIEQTNALVQTAERMGWGTNIIDQLVLARFMEHGLYAKHLRKLKHMHAEKKQQVAAFLQKNLPPCCLLNVPPSGIHMTIEFPSEKIEKIVMEDGGKLNLPIQNISYYMIKQKAVPGILVEYRSLTDDLTKKLAAIIRNAVP